MEIKTCGECRHLESIEPMGLCKTTGTPLCLSIFPACSKFEPMKQTNGDVIRAIADNKKFAYYICEVSTKHKLFTADDLAEWLNAPAESEVEK